VADLQIEIAGGGANYPLASMPIVERRGSNFVASSGEGSSTYVDAEPFQRLVFERFGGGFGQPLLDRALGGLAGSGGDPTRFYATDGWTLKENVLMPGMARDLISYANPASPVAEKYEVPRGVLPIGNSPQNITAKFTTSSTVSISRFNILVWFWEFGNAPYTISATLNGSSYQSTAISDPKNYARWRWVALDRVAGGTNTLTAGNTHTLELNPFNSYNDYAIGCFAGLQDGVQDALIPYFQLVNNATSGVYRSWPTGAISHILELSNSGTPFYIAAGGDKIANISLPSAAIYTTASTIQGAVVFNNKLYVGRDSASGATDVWEVPNLTPAITAPPGTLTTHSIGANTIHDGKIYFVNGKTKSNIYSWGGLIATPPTEIIVADKIGKANSNGRNPINNIHIFLGRLYIFKPEGVWRADADPAKMQTAAPPNFDRIVDLSAQENINNCTVVCEHQGALYFNVGKYIYQLAITDTQPQINVMTVPFQMGQYVDNVLPDAMTTDGAYLYASFNNCGIAAYNGTGWHWVTHHFNNLAYGRRGMLMAQSATGGLSRLITADARQISSVPIPSLGQSYESQISVAEQNKAGWFITSIHNANLADIEKWYKSFGIRAYANGWRFKVVGAFDIEGNQPLSYRKIIELSWINGLMRDRSNYEPDGFPFVNKVITKILDATGAETTTAMPTYWTETDFNNQLAYNEKQMSDNPINFPVKSQGLAFVLYWWRADGDYPANAATLDYAYIESLIIKYMPVLKWISSYSVTLDVGALSGVDGPGGSATDLADLKARLELIKTVGKMRTPARFVLRDYAGNEQTIIGFMRNLVLRHHAPSSVGTDGDGENAVADISFDILSVNEED
jgi:hypothetical protein